MKIKYVHGNLMEAPERFILHGCNSKKIMGSGVARLIRDRYPKAYEDYVMGSSLLGTLTWSINDPHVIINAITQEHYGYHGERYASYDAIAQALLAIEEAAIMTQSDQASAEAHGGIIEAVAMPLIGCGLGGAKWQIVSTIIEEACESFEPVVYLIDGKLPS